MMLQALNLPPEPLQMLPYLCTIIALVVVAKLDIKAEEKRKQNIMIK